MLNEIVDVLADPVDLTPLRGEDDFGRLVSESGHSYDVAKQGYVTLASGRGLNHEGDSLEMINSRETFLSNGHFAPFVEAVSDRVADVVEHAAGDHDPVILEAGAGTGYYLAHTLDLIDGARGVGLDISVPAAKHLAKAHPRLGAIVADVWEQLPIRTGAVDVVTVVFAPRNPAEFARVLSDDGEAVILVADQGHLDELREPLGILGVEDGKVARLIEQSAQWMTPVADPELISFPMTLGRDAIAAQVGMSPSARHLDKDVLHARLEDLPEQMEVTARAQLIRLRKK